jgi:hypothetical protein
MALSSYHVGTEGRPGRMSRLTILVAAIDRRSVIFLRIFGCVCLSFWVHFQFQVSSACISRCLGCCHHQCRCCYHWQGGSGTARARVLGPPFRRASFNLCVAPDELRLLFSDLPKEAIRYLGRPSEMSLRADKFPRGAVHGRCECLAEAHRRNPDTLTSWKVQVYPVYLLKHPDEAHVAEALFSRLTPCYISNGGGLVHHPAGLSNSFVKDPGQLVRTLVRAHEQGRFHQTGLTVRRNLGQLRRALKEDPVPAPPQRS